MPMMDSRPVAAGQTSDTTSAGGVPRTVSREGRTRAILAAAMIWVASGSSIGNLGDPHIIYFIYAGLQALICFRARITPSRGAGLIIAMVIYATWTMIASGLGMPGQFVGLLGMCLKITVVLLPLIFVKRPLIAVIDVMAFLCWIAIPIFLLRQIGLLAHFDIATLFQPIYQALGPQADRTLILYNFHTIGEETRNSGAFREPGMFACNIIMTAMLCVIPGLGMDSRQIRRRLALFFVALLTTGSTAGMSTIPIFALIALPYFLPSRSHRVLLAPVVAIAVVALIVFAGADHFDKIQHQMGGVETQQSTWYNTRFGNFIVDVQAIVERPLLGYGFAEEGRPKLFTVYNYHEGDALGFGNGLSGTAVKFGIPTTIVLYFLFAVATARLYRSTIKGFLVFVCLGMLLFSQGLLLLSAVYLFLCSRYPKSDLKREG